MYKVIFKGQVPEEFVDTVQGEELMQDWEHSRLPAKVKINGNLYESSAIKAVISGFQNPDKSDKSEENKKMMRDMWREYEDEKASALRLSLEKRAERTGLAEILYTQLTDRPMDEETRKEVVAAQLTFFKEHPDFSIAKPSCYKHIFKDFKRAPMYHISNHTAVAALNFAERVMANALPERG
jgi:hypothetical protein